MGQSSIEIGILQLEEEIKKSILEKNRTGDYRIGLRKAIDILANLKEMHKQEVIDARISEISFFNETERQEQRNEAEQYFNQTFKTESNGTT